MINEFYDKDGNPKKCMYCGSSDIKSEIKEQINYTPCEISYTCKYCEKEIAYWAYGYFDPYYVYKL
jgi:hypothetical protein